MSKPKPKFYVVWEGRETGIFKTWSECAAQTNQYPGAKFKSFKTMAEAEQALTTPPTYSFTERRELVKAPSATQRALVGEPIRESICVDGAWNTGNGECEYQAVNYATGERVFHQGPFDDGTNNIAEFLALVHALAHCKKHGLDVPVYSDSRNAISWVRQKRAKTKQPRSERNTKLFELVDRAERWLATNAYTTRILKWETRAWGENPADFGRK